MVEKPSVNLGRRERQIMDCVYRRGKASVNDVLGDMPDPPSYSAVRSFMRILEEKGHLKHKKEGPRYVYYPTLSRKIASRTALKRVLQTFFNGSVDKAVAALLAVSDTKLSDIQLEELSLVIKQAQKKGK
ncbi:BlaI/MecI/CopY family transcriptional regulator [Planctomycetota bacterium]